MKKIGRTGELTRDDIPTRKIGMVCVIADYHQLKTPPSSSWEVSHERQIYLSLVTSSERNNHISESLIDLNHGRVTSNFSILNKKTAAARPCA